MKSGDENVDFKVVKSPCLHLSWTSRMEISTSFVTKLRHSPFDKLHIPIKLELTSRTVKENDKGEPQVRYRFNFHKYTEATFKEKGC